LGRGSIDVSALRRASMLTTTVRSNDLAAALSVEVVLPTGTHAGSVRLNGSDATYRTVTTARGTEIVVDASV
jgi:hypothetical protein